MSHPDFSRHVQLIDAERHRLLSTLALLPRAEEATVARASLMSQFARLNTRCEDLRQRFYPEAALLTVGFGEATVWSRSGLPRTVWAAQHETRRVASSDSVPNRSATR